MYKFDHINVSTSDGGRTVRPSRYFDRFYDVIDPYDLSCKKVIWKDVAIHRNKVKLSKTSLAYEPMLAVENVSHPEEILSAFFPGALIKVFYFFRIFADQPVSAIRAITFVRLKDMAAYPGSAVPPCR